MKITASIIVSVILSLALKSLLHAYWTQKEGVRPDQIHEQDAWAFGIVGGFVIGFLVVEGIASIYHQP